VRVRRLKSFSQAPFGGYGQRLLPPEGVPHALRCFFFGSERLQKRNDQSIEKRRISTTATQNSLESFHEVLKSGTLGDVVEQMHVGINKHQQASTSPTIDEGVLLKINAPCIA